MRRRAIAIGAVGFAASALLLVLAMADVERTTLSFLAALAWLAGSGGALAALLHGQRMSLRGQVEILKRLDRLPTARDLRRLPKLEDLERVSSTRDVEHQVEALKRAVEAGNEAIAANNKAIAANSKTVEAGTKAIAANNKAVEAANNAMPPVIRHAVSEANEAMMWAIDARLVGISEQVVDRRDDMAADEVS